MDTWNRQPRESDVHWAWFQLYRDSAYPDGPAGAFQARSLAAVAEDIGYPLATLRGVADSFAWAQRAAAYDRAIDERRTESAMNEVDRQRAKHSRVWGQLWEGLENEVAKLVRQMQGEAPTLKPREVEALLKSATEMLRLLSGEHTQHLKVSDDIDYSKLSPEDMWQLRALLEKSKK